MGDETMGELDIWGRETKWENNEREMLIERVTIGLGKNLILGKFPRIHNDDHS